MISSRRKTTGGREYEVKDLSLADLGRREIELAQVEMPGLMACRDEFCPYNPFKGSRITVSSPVTARYAVLIETLTALGAQVRWCSSNYFSCTEDHAAAAIARDSASVFAWKGQTPEECWWCNERALDFGDGRGPDLIVDLSGNVTLLIDEGVKAEKVYAKTGQLPDPSSSADNAELQIVLGIIRDGLKNDPMRFQSMTKALVGVSIETAFGVKTPCLQMQAPGTLFPVIDVKASLTKSKFYNLSVCPGNAFRGKKVVVCDYDQAGKGCAIAWKQAGADVVVSEVDPARATEALLRGFPVKPLEAVVSHAYMFVANINNSSIFKVDHIKNMKDSAIIHVIRGPTLDLYRNTHTSILQNIRDMNHVVVVNPQTGEWVFPEIDSKITLLDNTSSGCPNFEASWSLTSHVVAVLELVSKRGTGKYKNKVYDLAEHLEEKMVALHLGKHAAAGSVMMKVKKTKKEIKEEANEAMNMRSMLYKGAQACSLVGLIAFGLSTASKVKMDLSFSAIWE